MVIKFLYQFRALQRCKKMFRPDVDEPKKASKRPGISVQLQPLDHDDAAPV